MNIKHISYYIAVLVCIALCGCSDVQNKMRRATHLLENDNPDSAYNVLRSIDVSAFEYDDYGEKAKYAMLFFDAADQSENTLPPDSLISLAVEYYRVRRNFNDLSHACYYKALLYLQSEQYDDAAEMLLEAERGAMLNKGKNIVLMGKIYSSLGDIMSFQDNNGNGRAEQKKSVEYFRQAGYLKGENEALVRLAYTYTAAADYDSALIFLRQAQRQSLDSTFTGQVLQETGRMYHAADIFDSAAVYLQNSLRYPMVKYQPAMRNELLAEIYFETERYDSAVIYAEETLKHTDNPYILENCYAVLGNVAWIKKTDKFIEYLHKHQECADSVAAIMRQPHLAEVRKTYEFKTAAASRKQTIWRIALFAAIALAVSWLIMYRIQKRNIRRRKEQKKLYSEQIKEQYEALCLQMQHDIAQAELRIEKKRNPADTQAEHRQRLVDILKTNLHLNAGNRNFFEFATSALNSLPEKLRNINSELTDRDIILCCLLALGLKNEQIYIVINCKPDALLKHKQRLASKLNAENVKAMQQMLYNMVIE
ncbi:MAG: hypothetical protein LBV75_00010 [Paludibacter sp.]|jgi:tetratricopeptide (TPR) repeat protein|nr:hypothetical protein [Paludibacter sp.]